MASKNTTDTPNEALAKRGARSSAISRKTHLFIGAHSDNTFREEAKRLGSLFTQTNTAVAILGSVYSHPYYESSTRPFQREYEAIYGDVDWTKASQDSQVTKEKLEAAFGNNDSDKAGQGEIDQERLITARGQGKTKNNSRELLSLHKGLLRSQNTFDSTNDEESIGVRGVEDTDAPIDSIA